ncbi:hypothetical protein C7378_1703 [Acidipila rosea]|uniref:Uncharacterized protein n=1 Tax=Acidipila rosea TaxID=768535 RepID=A0A4R1LAZ1_9BACT|nr:hypothetical protein C7378_1703 [Acidipila rosea]
MTGTTKGPSCVGCSVDVEEWFLLTDRVPEGKLYKFRQLIEAIML